ncbi:MAG: ATP-binding protein [Erysipelotrichaceae bacterium]|nr:ATP-binding protein [Erysipelotrichaceae bacterium]
MKNKSIVELESGEYIAILVQEITSIPKLDNLKNNIFDSVDKEIEYKNGFGNIISEIYQNYKSFNNQNNNVEFAIEFLWLTEKVENQPFNSSIRFFYISRVIANTKSEAEKICERITDSCCSALKLLKYTVSNISLENFSNTLNKIKFDKVSAIIKEEQNEFLNIQMLPSCYSFDVMGSFGYDMSTIVNCLINYPNSAISFQLIPTVLNENEKIAISNNAQILDTLSKGIVTGGSGNISFSVADGLSEVYKYYQTNRSSPLFLYNILVFGNDNEVDDISSKVLSYINNNAQKTVSLKNISINQNVIQYKDDLHATPWITIEELIHYSRNDYFLNGESINMDFYRLPYIITIEEASGLFRLPIGNRLIDAGVPVNDSNLEIKTYGENLINTGDIEIGILKSNNNSIGFSLKDLAKHMLIVGTPGSGKTTFSISILDRLWKEHRIPFLVIEPAKNEYRALIHSIPEIQVFTPGKNSISPFIFNPFVPPKHVKLEAYKSTLKTAFEAAVSMSTPLDKIFEETINNCYSDFRWLETYTTDDKGSIFNISDFIKCFENTFDDIGYTGDARNIGRAGIVRLKGLVNLFDNYFSIPIEDILSKPTIIELAAIDNSDQKALIISLLLLSILVYVNANYLGDNVLKNVILLEEAHVLLDADTNTGLGEANPSSIAQNLVKRMLAEIRAYGVGLIIADQSPKKVSLDVVALTDIKIVFRLVEAINKQIIADSMNMDDSQFGRLSRLKPGEAFLFFNRLDEPEEIKTPDYRLSNNINITITDNEIQNLTTYWNNKQKFLRPYPECKYCIYCHSKCNYDRRILSKEIARRIFAHNFKPNTNDFTVLKKVFSRISRLTIAELNDEPFSRELLLCIKVHLWRKIKYETKIPVNEQLIITSLERK